MHHLGLTMACHLLSSNDCNNPLVQAEGRRAGGGAHAATAAPSPSSAALQTGRAWPAAGEQQTSEEWRPAAPEDTQLQIMADGACRGHGGDRSVTGLGWDQWGMGNGPDVDQVQEDPSEGVG